MRYILILIFAVGIPSTLFAQTDQSSWTNLSALRAGQKIQIVEMTSKKHSGTLVHVTDTAISYDDAEGEQNLRKQDVESVKLLENNRRLHHTLIGAAVGAGAGAGIAAAAWEPHGFLGGRGTGAAVGAVIGGLSGAIVGAAMPSHTTIYRVNSH
jgi:outer membrane lipoprotein SlyB